MRYTKDIFDILSRCGFISQNSVSQQISNLYDAIEDDFQQYQDYFSGIGFCLKAATDIIISHDRRTRWNWRTRYSEWQNG